jgi:hypothetical protein
MNTSHTRQAQTTISATQWGFDVRRAKQNSGPKTTVYEKKPKSRSAANKVWTMVHDVYGKPPSWMRMIPARRWFENQEGNQEFTNTSRWEISFDDEGKELLILTGPAKQVVETTPMRGA